MRCFLTQMNDNAAKFAKWSPTVDRVLANMPVEQVWEFRKDFAGTLRSMTAIETAIHSVPTQSAHAVEKILGWVNARAAQAGNKNSGRIAKGRTGKHVLSEATLSRLSLCCDEVSPAIRSPIWPLMRTATLPENGAFLTYNTLNDAAYWALHTPFPLSPARRGHGWLVESFVEDALARLAAQGSLDAVAALWMLIVDSGKSTNDRKQNLVIASYIPPALALLSLSPVGLRASQLLFARIRQLTLDDLTLDGYQLSLEGYDLAKMAQSVIGWSPGCLGPANPYEKAFGSVKAAATPSVIEEWMERCRAPKRKVRKQAARPRWQADLYPSAQMFEQDRQRKHPGAPHPKSISIFQTALKDYWAPSLS